MGIPYFPIFVNLNGRRILIVGAGAVASRRAAVLVQFGAELMVVAPDGTAEMEALAREGAVCWERRAFRETDVPVGVWASESPNVSASVSMDAEVNAAKDVMMVLAATDDPDLNSRIAELCRQRGIPVNNCSDASQCDFYFPGIARSGDLVAGVTASGQDHRLTAAAAAGIRTVLAELHGELREDESRDSSGE